MKGWSKSHRFFPPLMVLASPKRCHRVNSSNSPPRHLTCTHLSIIPQDHMLLNTYTYICKANKHASTGPAIASESKHRAVLTGLENGNLAEEPSAPWETVPVATISSWRFRLCKSSQLLGEKCRPNQRDSSEKFPTGGHQREKMNLTR